MSTKSRKSSPKKTACTMAMSGHARLLQRAVALHQAGELDQAQALYEELLGRQPDEPNALYLCAVVAMQTGDHARAVERAGQAMLVNPGRAEIHVVHGKSLLELGQTQRALESLEKAVALQPDMAEAHFRLGQALLRLERYADALRCHDRALALAPEVAQAWSSSGLVLKKLQRWAEAVTRFDKAIALLPAYVFAFAERAQALIELDQPEQALASYDQALRHAPNHAEISAQKSLLLLLKGDFEKGWQLYESRWSCASFAFNARGFSRPRWTGSEPLAGKTILLHAEQGLGDTLQFCRYAPLLAQRGARVLLEVQPALAGLLGSLDGVAGVYAQGSTLPHFDCYCPLMSLPAALGTRLDSIPAPLSYLRAPAQRLALWSERLGQDERPTVGLVWRGGTRHSNDARRSIALADLLPHLPAGYRYLSLQKEVREDDRATLAGHAQMRHQGEMLADFSDTAALVCLCDAVISVDTSVAHLSGALGRPTLLLLPHRPDWRWLTSRTDSPWYPAMRLCRQQVQGDWSGVLAALAGQLGELLRAESVQSPGPTAPSTDGIRLKP